MASATVRSAFRWWRSRGVLLRDVIGTAAFAVVAFLPLFTLEGVVFGEVPATRPWGPLAVVLGLAQVLPLAGRRRWPAACLAIAGAGFAAYQCLGYPGSFTSEGLPLALYAAGAHQPRSRGRLAAAATAAYVATCIALASLHSAERFVDYVTFYLALASIWAAGALIRARQLGEAEHRRRDAEQAVAAERARIARELHDVVTHHVTAMVVRADAAQYLPADQQGRVTDQQGRVTDQQGRVTDQQGRVTGELNEISATGRRALTELRYLLNLLDTARPDEQPTFAAGRLRDLVDQTRQAGQPVELTEEGETVSLTDAAELSAYRVVQESLTNALKHAPGRRTVVRVSYDPEGLDIDVTTDGPVIPDGGFTAGRGLTGLRERVGQCGGELRAGGNPGGGFRVRARVPARQAADRAAKTGWARTDKAGTGKARTGRPRAGKARVSAAGPERVNVQ
jgi:signal transduction histidine kinase